ncbi:hypothetical protein GCM10009119_40770 [Algoriphagus jejuensis]|uniref:3-keto-alpha-glucoside-1,2-lyase/3-keto-2-hydroxy-glucal hydratase domain-containing protein n=1 Tax=Algoriphagus jejuensis TaxID=419934 RepID=A0ABN1N576_9BACT
MKEAITSLLLIALAQVAFGQVLAPNLQDESLWYLQNREVSKNYGNGVILNAAEGDGMMVLQDYTFNSGTIEFEVKGEDRQGASFVGLAFNIQDDTEYETFYFRPFNFQNEDRKTHSVQYTYNPDFPWEVLRTKFPGKYENLLDPAPDPNGWFHVRITIDKGQIKAFVNHQTKPSLEVQSLSKNEDGKIGIWVGNGSKGEFRNLKITSH